MPKARFFGPPFLVLVLASDLVALRPSAAFSFPTSVVVEPTAGFSCDGGVWSDILQDVLDLHLLSRAWPRPREGAREGTNACAREAWARKPAAAAAAAAAAHTHADKWHNLVDVLMACHYLLLRAALTLLDLTRAPVGDNLLAELRCCR